LFGHATAPSSLTKAKTDPLIVGSTSVSSAPI